MCALTVSLIVHEDYSHITPALQSFYATTKTPSTVYLTINTGEDTRIAALQTQFPDIRVRINNQPRSFAANHNAILQIAETEFVALLNDDIVLHDHALDTLVDYLQTHTEVGLVGPALENPDGRPQVSAYSDPSLIRTLYRLSGFAALTHQQSKLRRWLKQIGLLRLFNIESLKENAGTRPVPVIKGVAMVARRSAYQQAGVMDEVTQAYGEEYGWHLRLRRGGWKIVLVEEAKLTHYGLGQARLALRGWVLIEDRKAILAYYVLYRPVWQAALVRAVIVLSHAFYTLGWLPFDRSRAQTHWKTVRMGLGFNVKRDQIADKVP
ncbi:MAG: glycosyltransferase [Chitinophagaceae bacterium]|nr:glycosyltransferase [Anaerolineae bacterium]